MELAANRKPFMPVDQAQHKWVTIHPKPKIRGIADDVTFTLSVSSRKGSGPYDAIAFVRFKGEPGEWVAQRGPTFRVERDRESPLYLRLVPDMKGEYRAHARSRAQRLQIGHFTGWPWPNEKRAPTPAKWDGSAEWLLIELPESFLKPQSGK